MQAFQPRPLQGGSGGGSSMPTVDPDVLKKVFKVGAILALIVIAIIIFATGRKYSQTVASSSDQSARPLDTIVTDQVQLASPQAGQRVRFPMYIIGTARSGWFTNGVFPVQVFDGKNTLLASTYAIADVAPPDGGVATFRAVIERFDVQPQTHIGRVVLYRQVVRDTLRDGDLASIGVDFTDIGLPPLASPAAAANSSSAKVNSGTQPIDNILNSFTSTTSHASAGTFSQTTDSTRQAHSPQATTKDYVGSNGSRVPGPAGSNTCNDGVDNDRDKRIDSEDPDCHTDNDQGNNASYVGSRDENPAVAPTTTPATAGSGSNSSSTSSTSGQTTGRGPVWVKQQWIAPQ